MNPQSSNGTSETALVAGTSAKATCLATDARERALFELASDGILIADAQGRYVDANPGICRMLGYTRDELIGKCGSDIVAAAQVEKISSALDAIKSASAYQREWTFMRKDGSIFDAEVRATMLPDGSVLAVVRDDADSRRADGYRAYLAAIVESSGDAIIGKDLDGIIKSWNSGAEAIFGYPAGEMVGTSIRRLIPDDLHDEEDAILARLRGGQRIEHFQTRRRTRDGRNIDVSMTTSPIRDARGRIIGASKVARDITEQKAKAKASGSGHVFYPASMNESFAARVSLDDQLRVALEKQEFVLHYQPKVSVATGELTGAEALIRWNRPQFGLAPPGVFIPILEETGLIHQVGHWALQQAIADYLRWKRAGLPVQPIAVNVSSLQLRNPGFLAEIEQLIRIDPAAAAGLELEITESMVMEDIPNGISSLKAIREMGLSIALVEFGTGFSSRNDLSKLPLNALKIDRSFVNDMTDTPEGLSLVSSMVTRAHTLNLRVVAEGVETEDQARFLRLLRCDEMQGYLFSKPVPGDQFESSFLARSN
ncbi:MAG: EAL domain-containing protein [Luteimonas sp.]